METTHGKNGEGEYVGSTNHKPPTQAASMRTSEQRHAQRQRCITNPDACRTPTQRHRPRRRSRLHVTRYYIEAPDECTTVVVVAAAY